MGALSDLWQSERGLVAVTLILAMSVLTALGSFSAVQWLDYTKWIATVYIGSKTVTGALAIMGAPKSGAVSPDAPTTPTPQVTP